MLNKRMKQKDSDKIKRGKLKRVFFIDYYIELIIQCLNESCFYNNPNFDLTIVCINKCFLFDKNQIIDWNLHSNKHNI